MQTNEENKAKHLSYILFFCFPVFLHLSRSFSFEVIYIQAVLLEQINALIRATKAP